MSKALRWGILGTGNIARQFATGVASSRRSILSAVGSRSQQAAQAFAEMHSTPLALGSYDQVVAAPDVDAIYVALPNTLHKEWTIKALRAGKHVLCEKPFAINAAESEEMFDAAEKAGRVVIEAFMYRAHPLTHAILQAVHDGVIGQVRLIRTSFCYRTTRLQGNIRFSSDLAGGGLMDVGCYCINFARLVAGQEPSVIQAVANKHERIDDLAAATLVFPNGVIATMTCGMTVHADNAAYICGSEGYIVVPVPWKPPQHQASFTIARSTPPRQDHGGQSVPPPPRDTRYVEAGMDVYGVEADAFAAVVLDGQAPWVSKQDTLGNMRVLDEMRQQIGLIF